MVSCCNLILWYINYFETRVSGNTLGLSINNWCCIFLCLIHDINKDFKLHRNCYFDVVLHSFSWDVRFLSNSLALLADANSRPNFNVTFNRRNWGWIALYHYKSISEGFSLNTCSVSIFSNYMCYRIWSINI